MKESETYAIKPRPTAAVVTKTVWKALDVNVKNPETQHATKLLVVLRCFHGIDIKQV